MSSSLKMGLSIPTPIALRPLSTYITAPVMADARGEARKAAVFPTSSVSFIFQSKLESGENNKQSLRAIEIFFLFYLQIALSEGVHWLWSNQSSYQ